jgi:hypothetical protein
MKNHGTRSDRDSDGSDTVVRVLAATQISCRRTSVDGLIGIIMMILSVYDNNNNIVSPLFWHHHAGTRVSLCRHRTISVRKSSPCDQK